MTESEEITRLRTENAALRALVAGAQGALQTAQERIAQLERTVAQLQAAREQTKDPPAFVKKNTPAPPAERPAGTKRTAEHNKARRRAEPTQIIYPEFTRSPEGTTTRLTLASLCRTWLAQGHNPFLACLALLRQPSSLTQP